MNDQENSKEHLNSLNDIFRSLADMVKDGTIDSFVISANFEGDFRYAHGGSHHQRFTMLEVLRDSTLQSFYKNLDEGIRHIDIHTMEEISDE